MSYPTTRASGLFSVALSIAAAVYGALLFPAPSRADDFKSAHGDFFHVLHTKREDLRLRYVFEKDHGEKEGPAEFDLNAFSADGEVPVALSKDLYYRAGAGYGARLYDFKRIASARTALSSETLHRAQFAGGLGYFFGEDFLATGIARVGVFSDFDEGLESDDVQLHGEALGVYRFNPGAQVVFGVRVSEDFDDTPVLPLLGVRLMSDDGKVQLSLTAPVELRLGYNLDTEVQLYGQVSVSGEEYRIDAGRSDGRFNLSVHDRRYGLGVDMWFGSAVKLGVEGGLAVGSELDFKMDGAGQYSGDLDEAGYLQAELGFAL